MTTITRPQNRKMIAGVCAGLAQRYGWEVSKVRLAFVVSCLLPGPQILMYLALCLFMPKTDY